mmetsp:Transcript_24658/g.28211  ORF Transcript_24658/g.28211 Transcript_24658/m.28211 type:complete len:150 (-) Transcript_24658:6-455(-)
MIRIKRKISYKYSYLPNNCIVPSLPYNISSIMSPVGVLLTIIVCTFLVQCQTTFAFVLPNSALTTSTTAPKGTSSSRPISSMLYMGTNSNNGKESNNDNNSKGSNKKNVNKKSNNNSKKKPNKKQNQQPQPQPQPQLLQTQKQTQIQKQ